MKKADLKKLLAELTEDFTASGGEVVRYASPSNPTPIKFAPPEGLPKGNLREEAWQEYITQLQAGTYKPQVEGYQDAPKPKGKKANRPHHLGGPSWRDEGDHRGYKNVKKR